MGVELFPKDRKTLIGMIHLGELTGPPGFAGVDALVEQAIADLTALERGGIDAVLVENWKDQSRAPFVDAESAAVMGAVLETVVDAGDSKIFRAGLDGSGEEAIVVLSANTYNLQIALDPLNEGQDPDMCDPPVPALSAYGVAVLALLLLVTMTRISRSAEAVPG